MRGGPHPRDGRGALLCVRRHAGRGADGEGRARGGVHEERERDGGNGWLAQDPRQLQRVLGGRWRTHDYKAGDVVVFSTYTVHCGLDNHTNRVRISTDSRYQSAHEPRDDRWIGEDPIAHGAAGKRGKVC